MSNNDPESKAKTLIVGVGHGGSQAIRGMMAQGGDGASFAIIGTADEDTPSSTATRITVHKPNMGSDTAAYKSDERFRTLVHGFDMVFVIAGMGGEIGTAIAPAVAQRAKEAGALSIGIVTRPFDFEGADRRKIADEGIKQMNPCCDTLITIPNQQLYSASESLSRKEAFEQADQALYQAVKGIVHIQRSSSVVTVNFNDICTIMKDKGYGLVGFGHAGGESAVKEATQKALHSPMLDTSPLSSARTVLITFTTSLDTTLFALYAAAQQIQDAAHRESNVIFGWVCEPAITAATVTIVATGLE